VSRNRVSRIERAEIEKTQIDTLPRCVAALGETVRPAVQIGNEGFQIA
jgi:predicted XRE-type DNA-binding protein